MWEISGVSYIIEILLCLFSVFLFFYYFDIFFLRKSNKCYLLLGVLIFVFWQFCMSASINFPIAFNIIITTLVTLASVMEIYIGTLWNKCIFVIAFNAIWMLMETLCNYILVIYCREYAENKTLGSFLSKIFFFVVIIALKRVFTSEEIQELPFKYSIMLVLIPTGSIYIMNNIFMLGFAINSNNSRLDSVITSIILLGMNALIFYIYIRLTEDLRLRRINSVYEQQLELCERHQHERELSMLQLRDAKHNMKNNLISILAYAENKDYDKIVEFVNEIMDGSGIGKSAYLNSGNIVIDSLIWYWGIAAEKKGIDFLTEIQIPMIMPFKGADICLILGNLLENAVEAAQKAKERRYIKIKMKYDKNNLLLFVLNGYDGKLKRTKDHRLRTTKSDSCNHGVGLASVYRAAAKYNGTVIIDDSMEKQFKVKVLLYGETE